MLVPLKIKQDAAPGDQVHVAKFTFINRRGTPFGEIIEIKYKVVEPINEVEFYQKAMTMFENQQLPQFASFDLIVDVLKQTRGDEQKATQILKEKLEKEGKQEE